MRLRRPRRLPRLRLGPIVTPTTGRRAGGVKAEESMERRTFLKASAAASALTALGAGPGRAEDEETLYAAAKQDGQVTWYVAHFDSQTADAIGNAFGKRYPGVKANVARSTAQVAYQRLSQDLKTGIAECDVFGSTDLGHYVRLQPTGVFVKWTPPNAAALIPAFRNIDSQGDYLCTSAGVICLTYNSDKVKESEAPRNWPDLLDPKWKNQVSLGHPGYSGYVGTWVVTMRKLYGWDFFDKLRDNNPQIGRSIVDTVTMLNSGERSVAAGPDAPTLESAARGNPLGVIYPRDGAVLVISPTAIMKNSTRQNAAKLFVNFLLSKEASEVLVEHFLNPMVPGVAPPKGATVIAEVKTVRPTTEEITDGIPQVIKQWRDTFGV
jgi:iron(III) transport system substrate-binding protein